MVKLAHVTADHKLAYQVAGFVRELPEEVQVLRFKSMEEFFESMTSDFGESGFGETGNGAGSTAQEKLVDVSDIGSGRVSREKSPHLAAVIVDREFIASDAVRWATDLRAQIARSQAGQSGPDVKLVALAFEEAENIADHYRRAGIDDLILKPLDRAFFLQKMELLLSRKPSITPSFLFRQKTSVRIEVGKDVTIDDVSDVAITIANPAPLKQGLSVTIYSDVFGEGTDARVLARVMKCAPHPLFAGHYRVSLSYFGITGEQLANLRKFIRLSKRNADPGQRSFSEATAAVAAAGETKRIAVIDMNPPAHAEIKSALETNFANVEVEFFPSYGRFLAELKKTRPANGALGPDEEETRKASRSNRVERSDEAGDGSGPAAAAAAALSSLPGGRNLTILLEGAHYDMIGFEPLPLSGERVLGYEPSYWLERPERFLNAVLRDDREEFEEFLSYVEAGGNGHTSFRMLDAKQNPVHLEADGSVSPFGTALRPQLKIVVNEIDEESWRAGVNRDRRLADLQAFRFDAIFIDASFMRSQPQAWMENFVGALRKTGVLESRSEMPGLIVLAETNFRDSPELYHIKGILDFLWKPLDRKFLVKKAGVLISGLVRQSQVAELEFVPFPGRARVASPALMDQVSEYGLSILSPTPIRAKSFIRFFSPLFGAGSEGVLAQCHFFEEVDQDPTTGQKRFRCHFLFYGASADLLSRIRTWIREDYVARKEGTVR